MRINFFEEFPNDKTLAKLKLIAFDSTIYLAAKSFAEFENYVMLAKKYADYKHIEFAYWPLLEKSY